ncbi:unnamed protein product [Cyprideis torosa]|uniref:Uncharacterized protein n=1 Tax=Cyprideis torosa TaxID=163714 RepID=A0A7R8ZRR5_9CRUS|nr:unnamed protein product [Cyprideis torosa]CAG0894631.1 unnamed protein product [Cyprideis torosa]
MAPCLSWPPVSVGPLSQLAPCLSWPPVSVGPLSQLATLSQLAPCSSSVAGSKTLPSPGVTGDSPSPMRRPPPPVPTEDGLGTAIVKYNYQAQQGDELPLVKGARIQILEKSNDGWWRGQYNGQVRHGMQDESWGVEAWDRVEQELSFRKGEKLEIIERPITGEALDLGNCFVLDQANYPEWWRARNAIGQEGLVPRNYLQQIGEVVQGQYEAFRRPPDGSSAVSKPSEVSGLLAGLNLNPDTSEKPHLAGKSWYYGPIARAQCDVLLAEYGRDGDFIIRDSETNAGDYSVSLKAPGRNKHFRVHVDGALYCIGQHRML